MRTPYPRTPHLPWSPGSTADDLRTGSGGLDGLRGREVVVTEKLDGENTTVYADGVHARSVDSGHHPSRSWVKGLQGRVGRALGPGRRICGENLYAVHSVAYTDLDGYFYGFSVWDGERCLPWDETVSFLRGLGIPVPRVLWRGVFDEKALRRLVVDTERQEGYVVRPVAGFSREDFAHRVAKWVRPRHVRTDRHWMTAPVVPNGLGPGAALWAARSGEDVSAAALAAAVGVDGHRETGVAVDGLGDRRVAGLLAAALSGHRRPRLLGGLAPVTGTALARRVADLVGLAPLPRREFPDEARRQGLVRLAMAADLGVLHAVAAATAEDDRERELVAWSLLHAEDAGLTGPEPFAGVDLPHPRCAAEAREASARAGRVLTRPEAEAATWRWRSGDFPSLLHLVGPSGSGKSRFAEQAGADAVVSLDGLRAEAGDRADQGANGAVLRAGLARLDAALAAGGEVVWDATSLTGPQRSLVRRVADRRDAFVTHAVFVVGEDELAARNAGRAHAVPGGVLEAQLRRYAPPYPGQAHRTVYVGADGRVADADQ